MSSSGGLRRGALALLLLAALPALASGPKTNTKPPPPTKPCPPAVVLVTNTVTICPVPFSDYPIQPRRTYALYVTTMGRDSVWSRPRLAATLRCLDQAGTLRVIVPGAAVTKTHWRLVDITCKPRAEVLPLPKPVAQPGLTRILLNGRLRPTL